MGGPKEDQPNIAHEAQRVHARAKDARRQRACKCGALLRSSLRFPFLRDGCPRTRNDSRNRLGKFPYMACFGSFDILAMSEDAYLDDRRDPNADTGSHAARFAGGVDEGEPAPRVADDGRPVGSVVASRYTLTARLGRARLGVVYEAVDRMLSDLELGLEHRVALHLLHRHVGQQTRLLRKLEACYQQPHLWAHPNAVNVRGFGCDSGQYFLVTELLEGVSLRALLDDMQGDLPSAAETFAVLRGVGDALEYAHAKGAVHGDIRPETIFVTEHCAIKVLDLLPASSARTAQFFVEDVAPDALATPDPRDDVYGLACVAYELLSGSHPFGGSSPREALEAGLAPAPVSGIDARQLDALRRALALRRVQRTVSVAAFLAELGVTEQETLHALSKATQSTAPSDVPIVGEQSADGETSDEAPDVRASDVGTRLPQWVDYQRAATRTTDSPLRIDPADIRWHAHLAAVSESRKTSFGIWLALVAALGVAVYWNHEDLGHFVGSSIANAASLTADLAQKSAPVPLQPASAVAKVDAPAAVTPEKRVAGAAPARAATETFEFSRSVDTVSESRAAASLRIRRRGGALGESSIVWWTSDGSASASEDYADLGTVVEGFAAGEEARTISIPIIGDARSEARESFYVNLAKRGAGSDLAQPAQRIEIVVADDD
jgi:serine/threonine protein kinase